MKFVQMLGRITVCMAFLTWVGAVGGYEVGNYGFERVILFQLLSVVMMIAGVFVNNLMELKIRKRNRKRLQAFVSDFDRDLIEFRRAV